MTATTERAQQPPTGQRRLRVCHIVHSADVGGVESAVAQLQQHPPAGVDYRVGMLARQPAPDTAVAIKRPDHAGPGLNNPLSVWSLARWVRRQDANVVVASLWRSVIVALFLKMIDRRLTFVVFLHSTRYTNALDRIATTIGIKAAHAVFCDSQATRDALHSPDKNRQPSHIVPLSAHGSITRVVRRRQESGLNLVYWGRFAAQKRIDRALTVVASLVELNPGPVHFTLVGPDAGQLADLQAAAAHRGIAENVTWQGPAAWETIVEVARNASFFLQLSDFEGRGMAVIEAMQLGMVPVVTPVGQIATFASDGHNAIHYQDPLATARRLVDVWQQPDCFRALSDRAVRQWDSAPDATESFGQACMAATTWASR